ncbi:MAG TPA: hypothetical protein VGK73_22710, partial [Polyangiaceae bacterium]
DPAFPEPNEFSLHFMLVDGNGHQPPRDYAPATWAARYDLIGPAAPRDLEADVGDGMLLLSWAAEEERGDIDHYNAYCDPALSATLDGTGGQRSGDCPTAPFSSTAPPPEYYCGKSEGYRSSLETLPLQNDVLHVVAVAAVDQFLNIGTLSAAACEAPQDSPPLPIESRGCSCTVREDRSNGMEAFLVCGALALYTLRCRKQRRL